MRLLFACAALYLLSGIYIVGSDEVGVVRLFGRVWQERVPSGLHYRPPFPFTKLDKVKVRQVRRVTIGMEAPDVVMGRQTNPLQAQFLTGDQNIILVRAVIQYTVRDPVKFLFTAVDPEGIIQRVTESALANEIAQMPVDEVMTTGKIAIQNRVRQRAQSWLDRIGVSVVAVTIEKVAPPDPVKDAFEAVTQARQNRHRLILEAQSYANTVIPQARGEAQKLINEAVAYRDRRIAEAKGEAERFLTLLAEYRKAKDVTSARLYLEAMEELLPKIKKVIVDPHGGQLDVGMVQRQP
ncbi:Modulator of FtsH protease HflK [bacterium HR17]|jgi:membrane protease subunit HflK|uniref:Protein HflK n=1 Tax=Candidatus Fervidibacter japonicus TaxID=2035412 RepID=A0A2H5XF75_9BACT|nr:Modulator of FtsH protease HflK [bacterium HR17]